MFEYTTFANSAGASPAIGAVKQMTAYFQNVAVPGYPKVMSSTGVLVSPPWKNSLVLPADVSQATWLAAYNAAYGTSYTTSQFAFGTAASAKAPNANGTYTLGSALSTAYGSYFYNNSVAWATPEGITNPQSFGFPQVGINGKDSALPGGDCVRARPIPLANIARVRSFPSRSPGAQHPARQLRGVPGEAQLPQRHDRHARHQQRRAVVPVRVPHPGAAVRLHHLRHRHPGLAGRLGSHQLPRCVVQRAC